MEEQSEEVSCQNNPSRLHTHHPDSWLEIPGLCSHAEAFFKTAVQNRNRTCHVDFIFSYFMTSSEGDLHGSSASAENSFSLFRDFSQKFSQTLACVDKIKIKVRPCSICLWVLEVYMIFQADFIQRGKQMEYDCKRGRWRSA